MNVVLNQATVKPTAWLKTIMHTVHCSCFIVLIDLKRIHHFTKTRVVLQRNIRWSPSVHDFCSPFRGARCPCVCVLVLSCSKGIFSQLAELISTVLYMELLISSINTLSCRTHSFPPPLYTHAINTAFNEIISLGSRVTIAFFRLLTDTLHVCQQLQLDYRNQSVCFANTYSHGHSSIVSVQSIKYVAQECI